MTVSDVYRTTIKHLSGEPGRRTATRLTVTQTGALERGALDLLPPLRYYCPQRAAERKVEQQSGHWRGLPPV